MSTSNDSTGKGCGKQARGGGLDIGALGYSKPFEVLCLWLIANRGRSCRYREASATTVVLDARTRPDRTEESLSAQAQTRATELGLGC